MGAHPKPERIRDETLKAEVRARECLIGNRDCTKGTDPDHVKTKGAGGDDRRENLMNLCRFHHVEKGTIGVKTFIKNYGIEYSGELGKWIRR